MKQQHRKNALEGEQAPLGPTLPHLPGSGGMLRGAQSEGVRPPSLLCAAAEV